MNAWGGKPTPTIFLGGQAPQIVLAGGHFHDPDQLFLRVGVLALWRGLQEVRQSLRLILHLFLDRVKQPILTKSKLKK